MTSLVVGVDVGGTKTLALTDGGATPGRSSGPGAAIRPGRALASGAIIAEVVRQALREAGSREAKAIVIGVAGGGRDEDRRELERYIRSENLATRVRVTTDGQIALTAAFGDGPGVVVIAGTGSIVLGRSADGVLHRQGGYGWHMGDEGSAYAMGRAALMAVGRAQDGRSPATQLQARLLEASHSASFEKLVRWSVEANAQEVAALARAVTAAAAESDVTAEAIIAGAAGDLATQVIALVSAAGLAPPVRVAFAGGMLISGPVRDALETRLRAEAGLERVPEDVEPAMGAITLARTLAAEA